MAAKESITKKCVKCESEKHAHEFNKQKRSSDGLMSYCRSCQSSIFKKWSAENKNKRADYMQA